MTAHMHVTETEPHFVSPIHLTIKDVVPGRVLQLSSVRLYGIGKKSDLFNLKQIYCFETLLLYFSDLPRMPNGSFAFVDTFITLDNYCFTISLHGN